MREGARHVCTCAYHRKAGDKCMLPVPRKTRIPTIQVFEQLDPRYLVKNGSKEQYLVSSAGPPLVSAAKYPC